MSTVESSGYVSNLEFMQWLAEHADQLSEAQRGLMLDTELRTEVVKDLTEIQGSLGVSSPEETKAAAEAMMEAYAGTACEAEVNELLQNLISSLDNRIDNYDSSMPDELISTLSGNIQALIDDYGKEDQFAMIEIQDLISRNRQDTELVSKIVSERHQASMAILANM